MRHVLQNYALFGLAAVLVAIVSASEITAFVNRADASQPAVAAPEIVTVFETVRRVVEARRRSAGADAETVDAMLASASIRDAEGLLIGRDTPAYGPALRRWDGMDRTKRDRLVLDAVTLAVVEYRANEDEPFVFTAPPSPSLRGAEVR